MVNAATVIILAGKVPTTTIGCKWWVRIFVFWGMLQIASSGPFLKKTVSSSLTPLNPTGNRGRKVNCSQAIVRTNYYNLGLELTRGVHGEDGHYGARYG
jgi:hypothetical protein